MTSRNDFWFVTLAESREGVAAWAVTLFRKRHRRETLVKCTRA
jgi:hypothetical protein